MPSSAPAYLPAGVPLLAEARAHYSQFLLAQAKARSSPPPPTTSVPAYHAMDYDGVTAESQEWPGGAAEEEAETADLEESMEASVDGILNC